ncbi:MAG: cyclodeaminase/cyclohydrolase family protein [Vicinamibacterales bacterium]
MNTLSTTSLPDLLDAFSSPDPTPGGGSAAALMGAIGASLLAMVAGLPKTKSGTPGEREALDAARARLIELRATLSDLIDRDAAAYDLVVAAFRKPKGTDEEKAARSKAIQDAMRVATEVPIETVEACAAAREAAAAVAESGNPSAVSDVAVGLQALMTAITGALFNVEINIGSLKDAALVESLNGRLAAAGDRMTEANARLFRPGDDGAQPLLDLMKKAHTRFGRPNAQAPKPGDPATVERAAPAAAEILRMLGTDDARRALDVLAGSTDATIARPAREALDRFGR